VTQCELNLGVVHLSHHNHPNPNLNPILRILVWCENGLVPVHFICSGVNFIIKVGAPLLSPSLLPPFPPLPSLPVPLPSLPLSSLTLPPLP